MAAGEHGGPGGVGGHVTPTAVPVATLLQAQGAGGMGDLGAGEPRATVSEQEMLSGIVRLPRPPSLSAFQPYATLAAGLFMQQQQQQLQQQHLSNDNVSPRPSNSELEQQVVARLEQQVARQYNDHVGAMTGQAAAAAVAAAAPAAAAPAMISQPFSLGGGYPSASDLLKLLAPCADMLTKHTSSGQTPQPPPVLPAELTLSASVANFASQQQQQQEHASPEMSVPPPPPRSSKATPPSKKKRLLRRHSTGGQQNGGAIESNSALATASGGAVFPRGVWKDKGRRRYKARIWVPELKHTVLIGSSFEGTTEASMAYDCVSIFLRGRSINQPSALYTQSLPDSSASSAATAGDSTTSTPSSAAATLATAHGALAAVQEEVDTTAAVPDGMLSSRGGGAGGGATSRSVWDRICSMPNLEALCTSLRDGDSDLACALRRAHEHFALNNNTAAAVAETCG